MKFPPTLRDEYRIDFKGSLYNLVIRIIEDRYPYRNCLNCSHFTEGLEHCKVWNARPPARVIAYGCSRHEDVETIPF